MDIDKDVDVTVGDGVLTIDATRDQLTEEERRTEFNYGRFHRSILLPPGVDDDAISATYEDGILEVTVHMPVQATERHAVPISRNQ